MSKYSVNGRIAGHIARFFCMILRVIVVLALVLGCLPDNQACARSIATAGQDDGYSGRVLDRIAAKWNPPPQLIGDYKVRLVLSVDGDGSLLDCKVQKSSGHQALDVSACAAASAAAPFGSPPYGMPASLHFSFWSGGVNSRVHDNEREQVDTMRAERAVANARAANERAQAAAENAARRTGKKMPGTPATAEKKQPVIDRQAPVPKKTAVKAPDNAKDAVAPPIPAKTVAERKPAPESEAEKEPTAVEKNVGDVKYGRYIAKITWELRNSMYIPVETKPGTYYATVKITCDRQGKILSSDLIKDSGDAVLDRYVMQGIRRAGKIAPPPAGFGDTFEVVFTLVRK